MKRIALLLLPLAMMSAVAYAQSASIPIAAEATAASKTAIPTPSATSPADADAQSPPPVAPQGGTSLLLRGLDKITGRPTNIIAPVGKAVQFATLTITARFCYSTPPSETPETAAFVQIEDHRPDQSPRRVFPAGCMVPALASMQWSIRSMTCG